MDKKLKIPDENDRTDFDKMLDDLKFKKYYVKKTWHFDLENIFNKIRGLFK